jgi:hypothetical protein
MKFVGRRAFKWQNRNKYRVMVRKPEGKRKFTIFVDGIVLK